MRGLPSIIVVGLLLTGANARSADAAQDTGEQSLLDLDLETLMKEEVLVTANKRRENLQKVPISMSVINADVLERRGLASFQELSTGIPALSFRSSGPGRQTLTLRGLSSSAGSAPTVSVYVDETPIPPLSSTTTTAFQQVIPDLHLFDLERIEVLRGPQGTLYGSSSMGGTVRFLTRQPVLNSTHASATAAISNTDQGGVNWLSNGTINVPLGEQMALRVAAAYGDDSGFVDRLVGDFSGPNRRPTGPVRTDRDVNGVRSGSLRASLQIQPNDAVYLRPSVLLRRIRQDGRSYFDRPPDELQQRVSIAVPEPYADDFELFGLNAGWQATHFNLTSISSYVERDMHITQNESDSFFYSFGNGAPFDPATGRRTRDPNSPQWQTRVFPVADRDRQRVRDFTQELRMTSTREGRLQYLFGLYYKQTRTSGQVQEDVTGYSDAFPLYVASVGPDFGDNLYTFHSDSRYQEHAAFGEVDYNLTPRLKATLGARWYDYRLRLGTVANGLFAGTPVPLVTVLPVANETGINPRVIFSYSLNDATSIYATAAKGSRPGGSNAHAGDAQCADELQPLGFGAIPGEYDGDSLWNYELGAKNQFFSRRLTVNAAAYVVDWSRIQQRLNLLSCGFTFIANAGEARSEGMELEVDAVASDRLRLGFGLGYVDAHITEAPAGAPVLPGQKLLDAPEWTGNAWAEYTFALWPGLRGYVRTDWSYTGASVENFDNGRIPDSTADPFGSDRKSYDLAQLRFGAVAERWSATLFVHNVFNQRAEYTRSDTLGILYDSVRQVVTNRPRTIGVSASMQF